MFRTSYNRNRPFGSINNKQHLQTAFNVATEGIVLLKNTDMLLPIKVSEKLSIAIIGENAIKSMTVGGGSSELKVNKEISPLEGVKNKFVNATIKYAKGYSSDKLNRNVILKKEALKICKNADIVIFFGGLNKNNSQDSENSDRLQYNLPYGQDVLIKELSKVNENIAVILISGNAVETSWKSNVKSIIQSWYLGSESGNAIASILSGEINASGNLPFSFPKMQI